VPDRPHLDEAPLAKRDLLRPLDRFLPGVALDQVEAAQGLLRLGEGAVHDLALPGLEADATGVAVRAQALPHDHLAGGLELDADPGVLERVLGNLISNALEYGRPPVVITADAVDNELRIAVEDAGEGIPPEQAAQRPTSCRWTRGD